jgi:hypothetical protein
MESLEQRNNKKLIVVIIVVLIVAVGYTAYKTGIIPGIGAGNQTARELKTEIENLKGKNLGVKYSQIMEQFFPLDMMPAAEKDQIKSGMSKMIEATDFSYASLTAKSDGSTGIVEINSPVVRQNMPEFGMGSLEYDYPKITVSKTAENPNHYRLDIPGNIEMFSEAEGKKQKLFTIASETYSSEFTIANNKISGLKSNARNMSFIEGRGNTTLFKIAEMNFDFYSRGNETAADNGMKLSVNNLIPGDMIKLMLGSIEPISINIDYAYKGENVGRALQELMAYPDKQALEAQKAAKDPNYKPQNLPEPVIKPFDGELKVSNFSLLMGGAGFSATANLQFKKEAPEPMPFGEVTLKLAQYQKLLDYLKKFMPVPQEQADKAIKFFGEIGENANGDIIVSIKFDGTENVLVGGKTMQQLEALEDQYYPVKADLPAKDAPVAAPPAPVKAKPLKTKSSDMI